MRPFGQALQYSLDNARIDTENYDYAIWIEEDYCSPPLAMEREGLLDQYFNDISVERVESEEKAWDSINDKPRLWAKSDQKNVNRVSHKELRMDSFTFWPANESSEQ